MADLTEDQREVLLALASYQDDLRPYIRTVAREAGQPVEQVRQTIRFFDSLGLVTHGPIYDPDSGAPLGSTWWLTERGLNFRKGLESQQVAA